MCSGRNDSTSSSCQTWSLHKMKMKYLSFTYILKVSNKMCFRNKYRYWYWKILQYLTGYWYWPQYFSTLSIDINTAVYFKYRYSLLFLGIGKNTASTYITQWNIWAIFLAFVLYKSNNENLCFFRFWKYIYHDEII